VYRAIEEWRRYEPEVDLYGSQRYAVELPDDDAHSPPTACVPALGETSPAGQI
jgi:hypothetical protein